MDSEDRLRKLEKEVQSLREELRELERVLHRAQMMTVRWVERKQEAQKPSTIE